MFCNLLVGRNVDSLIPEKTWVAWLTTHHCLWLIRRKM